MDRPSVIASLSLDKARAALLFLDDAGKSLEVNALQRYLDDALIMVTQGVDAMLNNNGIEHREDGALVVVPTTEPHDGRNTA